MSCLSWMSSHVLVCTAMRSVPSALLAPHASPKGLWAFKIIPVGIGQRSSDRLEIHACSIIRANLIKLGLSVMRRPLHDSFFLFVTTVSHHFTRLLYFTLYHSLDPARQWTQQLGTWWNSRTVPFLLRHNFCSAFATVLALRRTTPYRLQSWAKTVDFFRVWKGHLRNASGDQHHWILYHAHTLALASWEQYGTMMNDGQLTQPCSLVFLSCAATCDGFPFQSDAGGVEAHDAQWFDQAACPKFARDCRHSEEDHVGSYQIMSDRHTYQIVVYSTGMYWYCMYYGASSTAQGGGGSFKDRTL